MYHRSEMVRTVVLLLIAYFCANVSSDDDCILNALKILRGKTTNNVIPEEPQTHISTLTMQIDHNGQEPHTSPPTVQILSGKNTINGIVDEPQTPPSTFTNKETVQYSSPDNILNFEKLYLDLKEYYEQKLQKLQIENDLLKNLYTIPSKIQTFCTCNVTDRPTTNDCSNLKTDIFLEKVQDIQRQLSNITQNFKGSESHIECNRGRDAELQDDGWIDWKQLPGEAVEISAKGKELWVITSEKYIFRWNGSHWEHKPGSAVRVGSSPDGWTWIVDEKNKIHRWNVDKKNWDEMPGGLIQISAMSKDRALGVNSAQHIYLWSNNAWTHLPGGASWAGIGDGDERWVINSAQQIYRWNHQTYKWNQMPGAARTVDVQNPSRVIVTNTSNQIFIWKNNNWQMINGAGTRASINGSHYYTVNSAQEIFIGY